MFRSQTRLDHAFPLATALLVLLFAPSAADAGRSVSEANPELSWRAPSCQATVPTGSTVNATQPKTDQADDDDFFSWIKKMTQPTTSGGQKNTSTRPRSSNAGHGDGGRGGAGGGHGGGGGGGGGNGGH